MTTKIAFIFMLAAAQPLSAMLPGKHFNPPSTTKETDNKGAIELENTTLITNKEKAGRCSCGTMVICGSVLLIFVGFGLIFPIALCNHLFSCGSNSTIP